MKLLSKIVLIALIACATRGLASTVTPTPKTAYGSWDSITPSTVPKGATVTVLGWGADTAATPTATTGVVVKVFVDGVVTTQAPMGNERPDVTSYYGFSNSGFTVTIDTATLSLGQHTINLQIGGGPSGFNHYIKPVSGKGTITVIAPKPAGPAKPIAPATKS